MLLRNKRSKRYDLTCFCRRRRKDGTCLYVDEILDRVRADRAHLVRLVHPELDEQRFVIPETRLFINGKPTE